VQRQRQRQQSTRDTQPRTLKPNTWEDARSRKPTAPRERREWTDEEDAQVKKWYPTKGSTFLMQLLDRPRASIQQRALRLGVNGRGKRWSNREDVFVKHNYAKRTATYIAEKLGRTEMSVRQRLITLKLTNATARAWTKQEIEWLRKHYGTTTSAELAAELDRTVDAVEIKAGRIGLSKSSRKMTAQERKWIAKNLGEISMLNMSIQLGLAHSQVLKAARALGYYPRPNNRPWTPGEDDQLRQLYPTTTARELGELLDRTVPAVRVRAEKLGLTTPRELPRIWTKEEDAVVRKLYGKKTAVEIGKTINRTQFAVIARAKHLNVSRARHASNASPAEE
jgi:hypothetical protein